VVDLLTNGYRTGERGLWLQRVARLSRHLAPPGFPKYGYLLEHGDNLVGSIFTIFSSTIVNGKSKIRCSLANWYVSPEFRGHAAFLACRALKYKQVTYIHTGPTTETIPLLRAQGYKQYCCGQFFSIPLLSFGGHSARIEPIAIGNCVDSDLESSEHEMLRAHASFGCITLAFKAGGERYLFVFDPRFKAGLPFARLIYCRDIDDFIQFAQPLGRILARRGFLLVALDANGPVKGLVGRYFERAPRLFKGPDQPRLGDLAYTVGVVFNL
jgi:hypothetical protein